MCLEIVRANKGGRYGRPSVQAKLDAGYEPVSEVDRHYGTLWMGRPCADCQCASPETCLTLQDLGMACETHGVGDENPRN